MVAGLCGAALELCGDSCRRTAATACGPKLKVEDRSFPSLPTVPENPLHQLRVMGRLVHFRTKRPEPLPGTMVPGKSQRVKKSASKSWSTAPTVFTSVAWSSACCPRRSARRRLGEHEGARDVLVQELIVSSTRSVLEDVGVRQRRSATQDGGAPGVRLLSAPDAFHRAGRAQRRRSTLSILFGPHYAFTFQEHAGDGDPFDPRARQDQARSRIRTFGSDYLAYALVSSSWITTS